MLCCFRRFLTKMLFVFFTWKMDLKRQCSKLKANVCNCILQVLRVFKQLHRTRMDVFKEDDRALQGELGVNTGRRMSNGIFGGLS